MYMLMCIYAYIYIVIEAYLRAEWETSRMYFLRELISHFPRVNGDGQINQGPDLNEFNFIILLFSVF